MLHKNAQQLADAVLQPFIDTASEFVVNFCKQNFASSGPVTESFYNVRQDDKIYLMDSNAYGIVITAQFDPIGQVSTLVLNADYQLQDGGIIQMLYQRFTFPQGLEGAVVETLPLYYSNVSVSYQGVNAVPATVRDATALIAASLYQQAPRIATGLGSESLADYSYSMPGGSDGPDSAAGAVVASPVFHAKAPRPGDVGGSDWSELRCQLIRSTGVRRPSSRPELPARRASRSW